LRSKHPKVLKKVRAAFSAKVSGAKFKLNCSDV